MNIKIKLLIVFAIFAGFTACKKHDFDQPEIPDPCDANPGLKPNITIFEIQKLYNTGNLDTLKDDVLSFPPDSNYVLEATVVSSDEQGNFYKELYIQDSTGAMKISIDKSDLFNDFDFGQIVQIKLSGLNIQKDDYSAIYILGKNGSQGTYGFEISRITSLDIDNYIFRKSCAKSENVIPNILTIGSFYDTEVGKFVKFNNVEFIEADTGTTYFNPYNSSGHGTNKTIKNCSGDTLVVRTSEYAVFANDTIPSKNGSISGVLTKYGSTYQLYLNKINDVVMDNNRCN